MSAAESSSAELDDLQPGDLYLACACAAGDRAAIGVFEERHLASLEAACRSFRGLRLAPEDVRQMIRERLFVGTKEDGPKILLYRGEGDLGGWARVVLTRILINAARQGRREESSDEDVLAALTAGGDSPEIELLKHSCAAELRAAFIESLGTLSTRDRNLLRYQFVEGLSAAQIAKVYRSHRSTVMRWLSEARSRLEHEMRAALARRLRVSGSEFDSLLRAALSGFDVTLSRYLAKTP